MSRDRRLVRHPAPRGRPDARGRGLRAVVAGGGIAGLTAAIALAERGVTVDLYEREPYLGGRVGGWTTTLPDGTRTGMSRGFHAFFRQYYNLRTLLRRADPGLDVLTPVPDYPLVDAHGRTDTFQGLPLTPPWNALRFALRSPTFTARDLLRVDRRVAAALLDVRVPGTYTDLDRLDAREFLDRLRFPHAARHLAFDVFSRSFFAAPERLSAAELAVMFHLYFLGSSEGLLFDVAAAPFDRLWDPLAAHLTRQGGTIHTGTAVTRIEPGTRHTVHTGDGAVEADAVVLALDVGGLRRVVGDSPALGPRAWRDRIAALENAPPFLVRRLWLDRPVDSGRPAFLATGGLPPLDNVSVLDRFDSDAAAWARRTGGSVVELHAYAATVPRDETSAALLTRLHRLYPETRDAGIVADLSEWREDCPLFPPGSFARRPGVETPVEGVVLAGDGIRVDLPVALMERAATTGWTAANRLLAGWGVTGHDLESVPVRGRYAPLRLLPSAR
ncbi:FAD-dependent oxidoreductase [Prauserella sp. ASG 168]|uniref:FAD-dependent oxidoreductase n=2 Tax=Prauserella cavernicola TaxID=2800127 RepID=A0A934QNT1_9PSEU|nr:FAD-dependent oxidoreductase [Prauserella cavernicola]